MLCFFLERRKCEKWFPLDYDSCPECNSSLRKRPHPLEGLGCALRLFLPAFALLALGIWSNDLLENCLYTSIQGLRLETDPKRSLRAISFCQKQHFKQHQRYFIVLSDTDCILRPNPGYIFCLGPDYMLPQEYVFPAEEIKRITDFARVVCPRYSGAADDSFTVLAISNIDMDPALEVWSINNSSSEPELLWDDHHKRAMPEKPELIFGP